MWRSQRAHRHEQLEVSVLRDGFIMAEARFSTPALGTEGLATRHHYETASKFYMIYAFFGVIPEYIFLHHNRGSTNSPLMVFGAKMSLTARQRQYLKGLGHALSPVLQVGKEGINERQFASISKALDDHELIKINILETSELDRNEAAEKICTSLNADLVQVIGKKMLLYKKNKKTPKIVLPVQGK